MLSYFRNVSKRDLAARKRFVVVGTTVSFIIIFLIWFFLQFVSWKASSREEESLSQVPMPGKVESEKEKETLPRFLEEKHFPTSLVSPSNDRDFPNSSPEVLEPTSSPPSTSPSAPATSPKVSSDPFPTL